MFDFWTNHCLNAGLDMCQPTADDCHYVMPSPPYSKSTESKSTHSKPCKQAKCGIKLACFSLTPSLFLSLQGQRAHKEHEPVCSPPLMPWRKESQLSAPNEINCLQKLTLRREEREREGEFKWEFNSRDVCASSLGKIPLYRTHFTFSII